MNRHRKNILSMRGSAIHSGHEKLAKAILRDSKIKVISKGSSFYNATPFPILGLLRQWEDSSVYLPKESDIRAWKSKLRSILSPESTIVIAATPEEVSYQYLEVLDGGLIHECAHSLYTLSGYSYDVLRLADIFKKYGDPQFDYRPAIPLLQSLANVYEDGYIERKLQLDLLGALPKLQRVHQFVWDLEKPGFDLQPGEIGTHPTTERPIKGATPIAHLTCYLRDRTQQYLTNPPLDRYLDEVRHMVDTRLGHLIDRMDEIQDSYDAFEFAFETLNIIKEVSPEDLNPPPKEEQVKLEVGFGEEGNGESSTSDTVELPPEVQEALETLADQLSQLIKPDNLKDVNEATQKRWEQEVPKASDNDVPRSPFPYSKAADQVIFVEPKTDSKTHQIYKAMMDECKTKTMALRPRMLSIFRSQKKTRRKHHQAKGKRLGRHIAEITYKEKPKPYQTKTVKKAKEAAVSLILDESGSMGFLLQEARMVLASVALTIGDLKIPHEIIGFTSGDQRFPMEPSDWAQFTRSEAMRYRVFRTFDEPFNVESYRKLALTEASNSTPLPDAMEFGVQRLLQRSEGRKILMVVTDGRPAYWHRKYRSDDYQKMVQYQIEDYEKMGVIVLMIGIGGGADFVKAYPNSVCIKSSDTFTRQFNEFLFEQMKRLIIK